MRIFTEKDKLALAAALQSFIGEMTGTTVRVNTCQSYVEKALSAGILVDELLNRENYARLAEVTSKPDLDTYVDALIERTVLVKPIKDDDDWNDPAGFILYATVFHDFYQRINGTGGTFTTPMAKSNLMKAISRNSLQGILSEKLIEEVMEKSGKAEKLTCFNYIEIFLHDAEDYEIDNSLSEEQESRRAIFEDNTAEVPADEMQGEEGEVVDIQPDMSDVFEKNLITEGAETENDESIYGSDNWEQDEEDGTAASGTSGVYIAAYNPRQFKRDRVAEAVLTLSVAEIAEFAKYIATNADEDSITLEEFITALAQGRFDKKAESVEARQAHQYLNGELFKSFLDCVAMQGVEISEESATRMDILSDSWDMRDNKTRRLQKIKELVYQHAIDDNDLLGVIEDLETIYSKE